MREIVSPIVALLTPFDVFGRIDFSAFGAYLDYLSERGVRSVVANGTTAEFASLSLDERMATVEYCRSNFDGCIINHVSSNCIGNIRVLLNHAFGLSDFALVLPPYYYANQQVDGVGAFFEAVLASADQPVFLYNFPLHTQFKISNSLVGELANRYKNLIGIKDSSGSLDVADSFAGIRSPFSVYVGNDRLGFDVLQAGLAGSVTGAGSGFPECLVKIREYYSTGAVFAAGEIQEIFNRWNTWLKEFGGNEIALTKQTVAARLPGFPVNVRPPICPLTEKDADAVNSKALTFEDELLSLFRRIIDISN